MQICIIETDTYADYPLAQFPDTAQMFQEWLDPALPEATWASRAVHSGDALPRPEDYDGYLITGSRYGVYDALPWMAPLAQFIRDLKVRDIPVAGVCFGHQIIAHAHGARVEKSKHGWVVGTETYGDLTAFAMHQDQVLDTPKGAARVLSSARCQFARIDYAFPALSVQYHPEFSPAFMARLLDVCEGEEIDRELTEAARGTLEHPLDVTAIAEDFARFFRTHACKGFASRP